MSAAVIALATILAIVILAAAGVISLIYIRAHRTSADNERRPFWLSPVTPNFGMRFLHPAHSGSQITPFGSSQQRPIFNHEPGTNMRIAHRRPDGGWDFYDESPDNTTCFRSQEALEFADPSLSSSPTTPSAWNPSFPTTKGQEIRQRTEIIAPPPPAYSLEVAKSSVDSH